MLLGLLTLFVEGLGRCTSDEGETAGKAKDFGGGEVMLISSVIITIALLLQIAFK